MRTKLKPWTINASKWREENGYTGSEWIEYKNNMIVKLVVSGIACYSVGILLGWGIWG